MRVYLFRHADAVNVGEQGVGNDAVRMLSEKGRKQAKRMARALKGLGCAPGLVASSPLLRARETAEIAARVLGHGREVELLDLLASGGDPEELAGWLRKQTEESVMLVGHLPDLAEFGAYLLSRNTAISLSLRKAGVMCIAFEKNADPGRGTLEWLIQPEVLKALE